MESTNLRTVTVTFFTGDTSLLPHESNELCPSFSHPPEEYTARSGAGLHHYHVGGGPGRADLKKNVGVALEVIEHLIRTGHPVEALGPRCGRAAARFRILVRICFVFNGF